MPAAKNGFQILKNLHPKNIQGEFKKYAELFNFLLVYMYNELISQHSCRRDRCSSVSGVSISLCHS